MRRAKFSRADIVRLNLNPTAGREQQGDFRPALVLTPAAYNASGLAVIVPITQGGDFARYAGFAVPLSGSGAETQALFCVTRFAPLTLRPVAPSALSRSPRW